MKKLFSLLLILGLPLVVNAATFSEKDAFYVGDSVNVGIYSDDEAPSNGNLFHVLKDSKSGERTVTLIFDGTIDGSPSVYDEAELNENHDATTVLELSVVGKQLNSVIAKEGKAWNVEDYRLLSASDLSNLGISKDDNGFVIPSKYAFLNPIKLDGLPDPTYYNYWTMIEESATSVYCVELAEDGNSASLVGKDITSVQEGNAPKCAIRPVVVVDKKYILCNNTPHETPETPKNTDTGLTDYILPLAGIIAIAGVAIVLTKKKEVFKTI